MLHLDPPAEPVRSALHLHSGSRKQTQYDSRALKGPPAESVRTAGCSSGTKWLPARGRRRRAPGAERWRPAEEVGVEGLVLEWLCCWDCGVGLSGCCMNRCDAA